MDTKGQLLRQYTERMVFGTETPPLAGNPWLPRGSATRARSRDAPDADTDVARVRSNSHGETLAADVRRASGRSKDPTPSVASPDSAQTATDGSAESVRPIENATVAVTIQRPPHVHFYRNAIRELEAAGHDVAVFVRESEITTDLLDCYGIDYTVLVQDWSNGSLPRLAGMQAIYEGRLIRQLRALDPDVVTAIGGLAAAHAAPLVGARSVVFTDTEHATLTNRLMAPFADAIWTPDCFETDIGQHQHRYQSYHELAYLHPDRFAPDPAVLSATDVDPDRPIAVVRFTEWDAFHDIGAAGLDDPVDVVGRLEDAGAQVRLTSEAQIPDELTDRELDLPLDRVHDLLAYATLYLGEGATMASESAVLGTPALYVNTLRMGYTDQLEARYGLLHNFQGTFRHEHALRTAERIVSGRARNNWEASRERLLQDTVDTTDVILDALGVAAPRDAPDDGETPDADGVDRRTDNRVSGPPRP